MTNAMGLLPFEDDDPTLPWVHAFCLELEVASMLPLLMAPLAPLATAGTPPQEAAPTARRPCACAEASTERGEEVQSPALLDRFSASLERLPDDVTAVTVISIVIRLEGVIIIRVYTLRGLSDDDVGSG